MRFVFLTMDGTHAAALREAASRIQREHGLTLQLGLYYATSLRTSHDWETLKQDIASADFIFGARLFGEEYVRPLDHLLGQASVPICVITSNPSLIHHTRLGKFSLRSKEEESSSNGRTSLMQQLARKFKPGSGAGEIRRQLAVLRNLSKVLKHIPGKARDLYTYIAVHQYWLHSSTDNLYAMLCMLIEGYVPGQKGKLPIRDPIIYPDVALFHPDAPAPFSDLADYQKWQKSRAKASGRGKRTNGPAIPKLDQGCVGLLSLRTVALSGNTAHLDALVRALEQRGIEVRMAYSAGLDFRPTINRFYLKPKGQSRLINGASESTTQIDLLINGTGFSLVGGPAESRPEEAQAILEELNVGYIDLFPLGFQRVEEWQRDDSGLVPMHLTMNVAIPELDGASEPMVIGGPTAGSDSFVALHDQIEIVAQRVARRVALRRKHNAEKRIAIAIFSFPPNMGNIGTAAYLDVFESLYTLLQELQNQGYTVQMPENVDALRHAVTHGNAHHYGTDGNVAAFLSVNEYLRLFPASRDIEQFWGRAPGELLNDGNRFFILGVQLANVFIGIQPSFGYERDPMRLLMAKDAAPHHGFAAFYTWIEHIFKADAVIHFGTHGALEFMPGKQAGLSSTCWPVRLLGSLPNVYYYSVNNPSEGTIAKRRGAATLVSYMVPPLQQAGLYKGLRLLKDSLDRYRHKPSAELLTDIRTQAEKLEMTVALPPTNGTAPDDERYVAALAHELIQVEQRLIPVGLHTLGKPPSVEELADMLTLVATFNRPNPNLPPLPQLVAIGLGWNYEDLRATMKHDRTAQERWEQIDRICHEAVRRFIVDHQEHATKQVKRNGWFGRTASAAPQIVSAGADTYLHQQANILPGKLKDLWTFLDTLLDNILHDQELSGLVRALAGGYISPSPGNDIVRNPAVVPTGRNIYGLDPFRVPSAVAQDAGTRLVTEMLERLTHEQGALPETVAIVLWGIDNLKSDGEGVAQVFALIGARVVLDELGKASSVELIPLAELGRPRVDVVVTVSGIFRDLLHHQMVLLDKAVRLAAMADEPLEANFVRKHALQQCTELGITIEEASTRIFANAPGSYGANVNHLVESGTWDDEQQLSDAFLTRKSFSFNPQGEWRDCRLIMERALSTVDVTFQNIDSFEVGISDIDYYYESLGGVSKSVEVLRGKRPPVMVADAVSSTGRLSSLEQMLRLETRAKLLNPKWFEGMLAHGSEGVREIEARVNSTYGWSATTHSVEGWVYQGVAETYLLDDAMRDRLAKLNPNAAAAMTRRLLEANARGFWDADESTLEELRQIYDDLEDRLEGL